MGARQRWPRFLDSSARLPSCAYGVAEDRYPFDARDAGPLALVWVTISVGDDKLGSTTGSVVTARSVVTGSVVTTGLSGNGKLG